MAELREQKQGEKGQTAEKSVKILKSVTDSAFIREFKEFINRGSVVDLAIGVAVGGAFTSIAKSLVDDIIMPITGLLAGGVDLSKLAIDIPNIFGADNSVHIAYGNFLQNIVNFLVIAFVVFVIVRFFNRASADAEAKTKAEEAAKVESEKKVAK